MVWPLEKQKQKFNENEKKQPNIKKKNSFSEKKSISFISRIQSLKNDQNWRTEKKNSKTIFLFIK